MPFCPVERRENWWRFLKCRTYWEHPEVLAKKNTHLTRQSLDIRLSSWYWEQNSGSCSRDSLTGFGWLDPFYGAPEAPEGTGTQSANCPSSWKMQRDTMVPAWAPWHCPTHHLCMADRRRGGETDNLWFGVTQQPHLLGEGGRGQNQSGGKTAPFLYLIIWLGSSQDKQKLWRAFQFNKILMLEACF